MTSKYDICNIGLRSIRTAPIASFTDPAALTQATICGALYPTLLDFALEDGLWGFAHRIETLGLTTDTVFNWAYVYAYPNDCLRVNRIITDYEYINQTVSPFIPPESDFYTYDVKQQNPYEIVDIGGVTRIATNVPIAHVSYRRRVTDTTRFPPAFIMALGHLIGGEAAMSIIGGAEGRTVRQEELKIYQSYSVPALANSMNEQHTTAPENEFIRVRR